MKKTAISFLILLISISLFSQKTILRVENNFKKKQSFSSNDDVLPIYNYNTKNLALLFIDKRKIYNYLFDENLNKIDSMSTEKRPRKYKNPLGSSIFDNDYRVFLTDKSKEKFASIHFSFNNKTTTISELELNFTNTNEYFVQSISHQNKFYIITIEYNSNNLKVYSFDKNAKFMAHKIDLSSYKIMNRNYEDKLSAIFFSTNIGFNPSIKINKFDENSISALEQTSDYIKMYVRDNKVIFTIDNNNEYTQVLTIDLNSYKSTFRKINKIDKFKAKNSNSYLFEDKIFQVASNSNELYFIIRDYQTAELLNQYTIKKDAPISFKNSPIIQYGGAYAYKRVLTKSKQFLRKISNADIGITVDRVKNNYQVTLGGVKEINSGGVGMGMGMPVGSFGGISMFFNPAGFAYSSYKNTKSVTIKTILDNNFKHIEGTISKNAYDLLKEYQDSYDNPKKGETLFKYKGYFIFGHYNYSNLFYQLHKFINE
jgi:hypothetical protein